MRSKATSSRWQKKSNSLISRNITSGTSSWIQSRIASTSKMKRSKKRWCHFRSYSTLIQCSTIMKTQRMKYLANGNTHSHFRPRIESIFSFQEQKKSNFFGWPHFTGWHASRSLICSITQANRSCSFTRIGPLGTTTEWGTRTLRVVSRWSFHLSACRTSLQVE